MSFNYAYTIQFRDTDAAGVVYFANILTFCHLAYENSLIQAGIELKSFVSNPDFAVPLTHTEADFFRPLFCGDRVVIELTPHQLSHDRFEIQYQILPADGSHPTLREGEDRFSPLGLNQPPSYARALTRHVVIHPTTRKGQNLPPILHHWLVKFS
jgi:1,4-dihydroxy-2-naphthoyl-CoA hydrolase